MLVSCSFTSRMFDTELIMLQVKQKGLFKVFALLLLLFQENKLNSLVITVQNNLATC